MKGRTRLALFAGGLVLVLVLALGLGRLVGGGDHEMTKGTQMSSATMSEEMSHGAAGSGNADEPGTEDHAGMAAVGEMSSSEPAGLSIANERLRLVPESTRFDSTGAGALRFRVVTAEGEVVRDFVEEQERELHLIVVARDLSGYQHLHPTRDAEGVWSAEAEFENAGPYRVYADFESAGERTTLGFDVSVAGDYRPRTLEAPATSTTTAGYEVSVDEPSPGELEFSVTRGGKPVRDLEDYLGAKGHLVVLREGDLAYLHVHPESEGEPGTIAFVAHYPSAGRYRLYLQFQHEGRVRTAELTEEVGDGNH